MGVEARRTMLIQPRGEVSPGIYEMELHLSCLFRHRNERARFDKLWPRFLEAGQEHAAIYRRTGDSIVYRTESFLPGKADSRPFVLLLFGNPASQSTEAGMCFAHERPNREHRIWRALRRVGLFTPRGRTDTGAVAVRNNARKTALLTAQSTGPFRIGIDVLISLPSPASDPYWSGVNGVKRLLGARAFRSLIEAEKLRILALVRHHFGRGVIAFQRDAYESIRAADAPSYSLNRAMSGSLVGRCGDGATLLACAPPTRYAQTAKFTAVLAHYRDWLLSDAPTMPQHRTSS